MKWARVRDKSQYPNPKNKDADQDKKNDEACFAFYPDQKSLEKELEQTKNVWADYEFKFHFHKPEAASYESFQKRYEVFCGGYLLFYDRIVRSRAVDHILHFKWSPEKGTGKYSVKIFIIPPPQKPIKGHTKASQKTDDKYYRKESPGGVYQNMATGDDNIEDGFSVDPPPPPPPPPPTMH